MKPMGITKIITFTCFLFLFLSGNAQLYIGTGSIVHIDSGGLMAVKGDIENHSNISGLGKFVCNGANTQNLNCNGFTLPHLEIDNVYNIALGGDVRIENAALFTTGKLIHGNYNVVLSNRATTSGSGALKFFETNGIGRLVKELDANQTNLELPLGIGSTYLPAFIQTDALYNNASVSLQAKDAISSGYEKRHVRASDFTNVYWNIHQSGINGAVRVKGKYDLAYTGNESQMRGFFHNGVNWEMNQANIDYAQDSVGALITGNGDLYAMNRFVFASMKTFLQGAYNGTNMNDALRTPTNLIPLSDPYRSAPYNISFNHINNSITESVNASFFNNQLVADSNVVDWVFVELRTNNTPSTVLATRSALLLRNGTVVDVDRKNTLYFGNIDAGIYHLAIRHRNHIGIRTLTPQSLSLGAPTSINMALNTNVYNGYMATLAGGNYGMYAGNSNDDAIVKMTGLSANNNDYLKLLNTLGGSTNTLTNQYSKQDLNLDRTIKMTGLSAANNDYLRLLNTLGTSTSTLTQPNY
jgi:hypothetical protein